MKKTLSVMLSLALIAALALAACNGGGAPSAIGGSEADAPANTYALLLAGSLGDHALSDAAWQDGMKRAEAELGVKIQIAELKNDRAKREAVLFEWCDDAVYEAILIGFADNLDVAEIFAASYPEQKFILYDAAPDSSRGLKNVFGITYAQNEVSYLAGYCAAGMTKSGTVGVVGASETETIRDFILGYCEGAQMKDPSIRVLTAYNNGSWTDIATMKGLTLAQIQQGADVTFQVAGGAGLGMYEAAAEKGTWAIGVDGDHYGEFKGDRPEIAPSILTSAVKKVGESIFWAIERNEAGDLGYGTSVMLGIKEGAVGLARNENYEKNVPLALRAEIDAIEAKIISGEIKVGTAFGMPAEEFKALTDRLKG